MGWGYQIGVLMGIFWRFHPHALALHHSFNYTRLTAWLITRYATAYLLVSLVAPATAPHI